jgi:hypothetical protein
VRDAGSRFANSTHRAAAARTFFGGSRLTPAAPATSGGSGASATGGFTLRSRTLIGFAALAALALLFLVTGSSAQAARIHSVKSTFELQTRGEPRSIAIDEEMGYVYTLRRSNPNAIERFDEEGNPVPFPGTPGRNESQTVHFASFATGDMFTLTCPNGETTAEITWNNFAELLRENMSAALEAKCGTGNYELSSGPNNVNVHFEGAFAESDVPPMTCTKTAGSGTCEITNISDGAAEGSLNQIAGVECGESACVQLAVDNSGGPNQGVIYMGTSNNQFGCCPFFPNDQGAGVDIFLPSGQKVGVTHTDSTEHYYGGSPSNGVSVDSEGHLIITHGSTTVAGTYFDKLDVPNWSTPEPNLDPPILESIASDYANAGKTSLDAAGDLFTTVGYQSTASGPLRSYSASAFETSLPPVNQPGYEYPSSTPSQELAGGSNVEPAVDGEGNVLTVNTAGEFIRYSGDNGSPLEQFDIPSLLTPGGIAYDKTTHLAFITDRSGNGAAKDVTVLESAVVPDSKTGEFEPLTATTGMVDGEVDPVGAGEIEACQFEVVTQSQYNASKFAEADVFPCEPAAPLNSAQEVSAEVTGLTLEQTAKFRLVTTNANGTSNGAIRDFLPHAVIEIVTEAATEVAPRSATLNASFRGNADDTEYFFKWGLSKAYENSTPIEDAGSPTGPTSLAEAISGLELEETYHYKIVATNSVGTSEGEDMTFTTLPAVSNLTTKPASSIDQDSITLNAEFQGQNLDTHYYFEYGLTTEYGSSTAEAPGDDAGSTSGPTDVSSEITEFNGYRTYHYRVIAENSFGITYGQDETFVAPEPPPPAIENTHLVSVSPTSANVSADINPNHWATIYLFEWGETDHYGDQTSFSDPFGGLNHDPILQNGELTGLKPGSVYHFRAVAVNFRGTTEGEDVIFTTPAPPRIDRTNVTGVTKTTAHFEGLVAANGAASTTTFEYGIAGVGYTARTPVAAIGSNLFSTPVSADVGGLLPGTEYQVRIAATNEIDTTYGPVQTFTTVAEPPPPSKNCGRFGRQAKKKSNQAKRLRRNATKAHGNKARSLRKKAKRAAKQARKLSKKAKQCRGAGQ